MAQHLARIHGTEEDKVNCPFYFKIGACRHSDRCSRLHHRPAFSCTLLIKHLYRHPIRQAELNAASLGIATPPIDEAQAREDFFCFFEDLYLELSKFGQLEGLHVVDNIGDHMIGHVYVKFREEEQASDALMGLSGRYYDGRQLDVEFSPVSDFREARCRDYDEETCARGGFCNFLHVKPVPPCLIRSLDEDAMRAKEEEEEKQRRHRKRKKSSREEGSRRSRKSRRSRSRSYSRSTSREKDE
jgi:splicing factor U2AF subunit